MLPSAGNPLGGMTDPVAVAALGLPVVGDKPNPMMAAGGEGEKSASSKTGSSQATAGLVKGNKNPPVDGAAQTFVLSDGLAPIPAQLVSKILNGEFVDMSELLRDNLEAERKGALLDPSEASSPSSTKRSRREVPNLLSWVQCFDMYMAVIASQQPSRVMPLLAYQTLIIREARRCGGRGWLAYDSMFRQQVAGRAEANWSKLNSTLYAVTFLAQQGSGKIAYYV